METLLLEINVEDADGNFLFQGSNLISKVYIGDIQVFPSVTPTPTPAMRQDRTITTIEGVPNNYSRLSLMEMWYGYS